MKLYLFRSHFRSPQASHKLPMRDVFFEYFKENLIGTNNNNNKKQKWLDHHFQKPELKFRSPWHWPSGLLHKLYTLVLPQNVLGRVCCFWLQAAHLMGKEPLRPLCKHNKNLCNNMAPSPREPAAMIDSWRDAAAAAAVGPAAAAAMAEWCKRCIFILLKIDSLLLILKFDLKFSNMFVKKLY